MKLKRELCLFGKSEFRFQDRLRLTSLIGSLGGKKTRVDTPRQLSSEKLFIKKDLNIN